MDTHADGITRRTFLQTDVAAAVLAATPLPSAAAVPWYRRAYRWGQTNITAGFMHALVRPRILYVPVHVDGNRPVGGKNHHADSAEHRGDLGRAVCRAAWVRSGRRVAGRHGRDGRLRRMGRSEPRTGARRFVPLTRQYVQDVAAFERRTAGNCLFAGISARRRLVRMPHVPADGAAIIRARGRFEGHFDLRGSADRARRHSGPGRRHTLGIPQIG